MLILILLVVLLLLLSHVDAAAVLKSTLSAQNRGVLELVLGRAAGIYQDKGNHSINLDKTVILTGCNFGYINHLHNFKCFLDRLMLKSLVISMDDKTHEYVQRNMNDSMHSYLMAGGVGGTNMVKEAATEFRSPQFHIITNRKLEAVLHVMEMGYDVLFIDTGR